VPGGRRCWVADAEPSGAQVLPHKSRLFRGVLAPQESAAAARNDYPVRVVGSAALATCFSLAAILHFCRLCDLADLCCGQVKGAGLIDTKLADRSVREHVLAVASWAPHNTACSIACSCLSGCNPEPSASSCLPLKSVDAGKPHSTSCGTTRVGARWKPRQLSRLFVKRRGKAAC
jgi:hypothetical protein